VRPISVGRLSRAAGRRRPSGCSSFSRMDRDASRRRQTDAPLEETEDARRQFFVVEDEEELEAVLEAPLQKLDRLPSSEPAITRRPGSDRSGQGDRKRGDRKDCSSAAPGSLARSAGSPGPADQLRLHPLQTTSSTGSVSGCSAATKRPARADRHGPRRRPGDRARWSAEQDLQETRRSTPS
jgi:hypothetical protein